VHQALNRNLYFVKEHVGMFKAANNYDVLDPETGEVILECREDKLGFFTKLLRFTDFKRATRFDISIRTPDGQQVVRITRGFALLRSKVNVLDENNQRIGGFRQKLLSVGGAFTVMDDMDRPVCTLKGKWTGWDFRFLDLDGAELAHVTKKWAGLGKELFTTADNYILKIADDVPPDNVARQLIVAAVMCIDMVLKE